MYLHINLQSEVDTEHLAKILSRVCMTPCIIYLRGEIGAGKTTMVRYFLRHLGYQGRITSPTYTLVERYEVQGKEIYHFDFYRIKDPQELQELNLRDYLTEKAIWLIEWPEYGSGELPAYDLECSFVVTDEVTRKIIVKGQEVLMEFVHDSVHKLGLKYKIYQ